MSLTQEQVIHIARLAKLHITSAEIEHYQKDLNSIVGYIDILSSIPDSELQKVQGNIEHSLIPRLDEEHRDISREALLACSPQKIIHHQIAVDSLGIRA
ncbi:MAG: aspartyl/glutamyl-tRNA amidotransferase subunit C [Candidatus Gracilibacteria bacterium]|nr:aspartyl/glutamyl-tRNA amidotransferase subunit C [Candidatus Gracilibacteria bacterium]